MWCSKEKKSTNSRFFSFALSPFAVLAFPRPFLLCARKREKGAGTHLCLL
jgi:hypothetical protein